MATTAAGPRKPAALQAGAHPHRTRWFTAWAWTVTVLLGLLFTSLTALTLTLWASDPVYAETGPVVDLAFFALGGVLVTGGIASQVRGARAAGLHQSVLALLALAGAGLIGGRIEPSVGALVLLAATAPLIAWHPARQRLLAGGARPSRPLAVVALAAAVPGFVYATDMLGRARAAGPSCFLGQCAQGDRYAEAAALAMPWRWWHYSPRRVRTGGGCRRGAPASPRSSSASRPWPSPVRLARSAPCGRSRRWPGASRSSPSPRCSPAPRPMGQDRYPARQVILMANPTLVPQRVRAAATVVRWLTAATTVLVAGASTAGLWVSRLYNDGAAVEAMYRAYDLVTLVVVVPLLALTLLPAWRDRPASELLRVSLLAFCVYNYAYYLFGAQLNAALLAHVAIFTASLYGLVLSLVAVDVGGLAARFNPRTPVRTVAGILLLLGVPLAAIQISGLAGFALSGAAPNEPSQLVVTPTFTRLGAVLDLSLLVPAYLLAAVWLWRRRAWGYLLATVVLIAGALHQISYIAGMLFQLAADIPGAAFDPYEPIIIALFAAGSGLLLAGLRPARSDASPAGPDRGHALAGR